MEWTYYIVPAWSDIAGQCRIVKYPGTVKSPRDDYRKNPENWKEAGLMNSRGSLVCLCSSKAAKEFRDMEPLMAGLYIVVDEADSVNA